MRRLVCDEARNLGVRIGKEQFMSGLEPCISLLRLGKNVVLYMHLDWARRAGLAAVPIEPAIVRTLGIAHNGDLDAAAKAFADCLLNASKGVK